MQHDLHIISHFELLNSPFLAFDKLLHNEAANGVAGIALLRVSLDHHTSVDRWFMVLFVFRRVIRMHGMPHISRDQERVRDGLCVCFRSRREAADQRRNKVGLGP